MTKICKKAAQHFHRAEEITLREKHVFSCEGEVYFFLKEFQHPS
jgi:hypothetical protein